MTRLLVTGATGFVGRGLVARAVDKNMRVRGASRRILADADPRVDYCQVGELSADTDWSAALRDIDVVVHCAARVHVMQERSEAPLADFRAANLQATLSLARQAVSAGVRRFVFISSIGVNGAQTFGQPFTEADPPAPHSPYSVSKHEAELALNLLGAQTGLEIVIIRPPLVYGPDAPGNFGKLLRAVALGRLLPLGAINNRRSFVGNDNLADFILACTTDPNAAHQTFLISDDCDLSTTELLRTLALAAGVPSRLLSISPWILRMAGALFGKKDALVSLTGDLRVDISKARRLLGWTPPMSPMQGMQKIFDKEENVEKVV